MPKSKQRKQHHEQQRSQNLVKSNKSNSFIIVLAIFFVLIGIGIAFFATDGSIGWLLTGAVAGGVGGYFFAKQVEKSFSGK